MTNASLKKINIVSYSLLGLCILLTRTALEPAVDIPRAAIAIIIILYVGGANLTHLFELLTKTRFDPWVHSLLSILHSIITIPVITLAIYTAFDTTLRINSLFLIYTSLALIPFIESFFHPSQQKTTSISIPRPSQQTLHHPAFWIFAALLTIHSVNLMQYTFLPTPDTYSWVIHYESHIPQGVIDTQTTEQQRWAFASLVGAFYYLGDITIYSLFKYVFPALSLLISIPLWIIARQFDNKVHQIAILLLAFVSPTVIIEMEYARQQLIFLFFLYAAVALHLYLLKNPTKRAIYYLLGIYSVLGSFTHPAFLLYTTAWIVSLPAIHIAYIKKHKTATALAATLFVPMFLQTNFGNMALRIYEQGYVSAQHLVTGDWNLQFPAYFINSDGYEMSWPGFVGVAKYYSFYVGPLALSIIATSIIALVASRNARKKIFGLLRQTSMFPLFFLVVFFFIISEIAPRFARIAYLPDRSWQYLAILLIIPGYFLIKQIPQRLASPALCVVAAGAIINIAGSSYVNYLNSFTIPDYEQRAAVWIRQNLEPLGARVYASSSKNVLRYHGGVIYAGFSNTYYTNSDATAIIQHMITVLDLPTPLTTRMDNVIANIAAVQARSTSLLDSVKTIRTKNLAFGKSMLTTLQQYTDLLSSAQTELTQDIENLADVHYKTQLFGNNPEPIYIYYAKTHPKNPYAGRPYKSSFTQDLSIEQFPALDGLPEIFEPVYQDGNVVKIWRLHIENITEEMLL